jgi:hypothetical protein
LPRETNRYPGIPQPAEDLRSLHVTVLALKEAVETLTNQRVGALPPVTWVDLMRLGLASEADIPK